MLNKANNFIFFAEKFGRLNLIAYLCNIKQQNNPFRTEEPTDQTGTQNYGKVTFRTGKRD